MVNSLVLGSITLQTLIKPTRENSEVVIWRVKERSFGQMEGNMKEISKMGKKMEKECLNGLMEQSILELGGMGNSMD